MVKRTKINYPQPQNININSGNPALDERLIEIAHVKGKRKAKWTQKQKRTAKRREKLIELASQERLFCNSHLRYLCVKDVEERKCYMRHGRPPVCPHLRYEDSKGNLRLYGH